MKKFTVIWPIFLSLLCLFIIQNESTKPNEKRCGDKDCSVPISKAKTLVRYSSPEEGKISFSKGVEVEVLSKSSHLWTVKVGDKVGLAPASFLKELKVLIPPKDLISVTHYVAPSPVNVETTQNDSAELFVEKTSEIPAGSGSLLSFPSMASAQSVEGGESAVPTPSSPQYEVVDGTTLWMDPVPADAPIMLDKKGNEPAEASTDKPADMLPPASPESIDATKSSILDASDVVTQAPSETLVTPAVIEDNASSPGQTPESTTEASKEILEDSTTVPPSETTTKPSENTENSEEIEPTKAGIMSNIWNTMFNSDDGSEGNSQDAEAGEDEDDEEDAEEDADDGSEGDEDEAEEESSEADSKKSKLPAGDANDVNNVQQQTTSSPVSGEQENVSNFVVENIPETVPPPLMDLAASFPQVNNEEGSRFPRHADIVSKEEVSSEKLQQDSNSFQPDSLPTGEPEQLQAEITPLVDGKLDQEVKEEQKQKQQQTDYQGQEQEEKKQLELSAENTGVQDQDMQQPLSEEGLQQVDEQQRQLEEEALKKQQDDELKRQQEEEERKQKEEEEKKQKEEEERKQKEEEERKQKEEEERKQKEEQEKKLQEEEEKKQREEEEERKRIEEEARQQQEEEERKQQEEAERLQQEEQRRLQEEELRRQADERERENQRAYEAEQELWRQNQEKQRVREEEMKRAKKQEEEMRRLAEEAMRQQAVTEEENKLNNVIKEPPKIEEGGPNEQNVHEQEVSSTVQEDAVSSGMFSLFSGLFGGSTEEASNESVSVEKADDSGSVESPPSTTPPHYYHEHHSVWSAAEQTTCAASEEGCDMKDDRGTEDTRSIFEGIVAPSLDVILLRLVFFALFTFLGSFSIYFLRKKDSDSSYVARINELEKQLLIANKELVSLQDKSSVVSESVNSEELNLLREELESCRLVKVDLEEQVSTLERELEEATETGIELNRLLSETLEASKGKSHAGLVASVERLQQQLDGQRDKVDSLTRSLKSTSSENESLKSMIAESKERISALEAELAAAAEIASNLRKEREEASVVAAQQMQQVQSRLEEALSSKVLEESRLGSELSALKLKYETLRSSLSMKDAEVKALQDTLRNIEAGAGKVDELLDVSKLKAELEHIKSERDSYVERFKEAEKEKEGAEERMKNLSETLAKLEEKVDIADKQKEEAETRLTVLSNYFKEKEEQLQKELGLKEAIVAQHRGDESTVVKHLQSLQEEVNAYREQNESMKNEILDQERDFKSQIATLEKKAHDNWMAARHAERRLEDSRQEAAQLRNRLTLIEKSNTDPNSRMDANGEGGVASPVMMMPLPPLGDMETPPPIPPFMFSPPPYPPPFMPPPLPPHPMGRPPPLGRMSSPPPPPLGQFSPPPPPYDRLDRSSRSPSPPLHRYHHRSPPPQQWDEPRSSFRPVPKPSPKKPNDQRDHKGSTSNSGHSHELMDKSREHV